MPRAAHITVRKDPRSPALPWEVNIPASLSVTGIRERPHFSTLGEANQHKLKEERRLALYSENAFGLSNDEKREMAECKERVAKFGRSVREAVLLAVASWETDARSTDIHTLREELLKSKTEDKRSKRHLKQLSGVLLRFADAHSGQIVSAFTASQIDAWLRGLNISAVSRDTYRRRVSIAFEFGRRQGWCMKNPVADVARAGGSKHEVAVLSPAQVAKLLAACHPAVIAYVAIGAFAGLRPVEAERLRWTDISHDQIHVRAANAKTRKHRLVPVHPNLREWLALAGRSKDGCVGFSRRRFRDAWRKAGFAEWPQDALRHSYGTYRWPLVEHEGKLAQEMGNSPDIIVRHYRRLTDRKTAEAYFSIIP
jgi:integrase